MNTCEEAADNCGSSPDKCISIFYIWNCLLFIAKGPSIQFSHSVVSDSLWPHGLQHARLPWPSPTPRACSDSCPLSRWCHPTISSSVIPSPPACNLSQHQGLFTMSQFFASGGQSIGVSPSTSVLPMNIQVWCHLGGTGWISLQSKVSQQSSSTPQFKSSNSLSLSFLYNPTLTSIHDHWKNHGKLLHLPFVFHQAK